MCVFCDRCCEKTFWDCTNCTCQLKFSPLTEVGRIEVLLCVRSSRLAIPVSWLSGRVKKKTTTWHSAISVACKVPKALDLLASPCFCYMSGPTSYPILCHFDSTRLKSDGGYGSPLVRYRYCILHDACTNGIGSFTGCQGRSSYSLWHLQSLPWSMSSQVLHEGSAHVSSSTKNTGVTCLFAEQSVKVSTFPKTLVIDGFQNEFPFPGGPQFSGKPAVTFLGAWFYSFLQETPCTLDQHSMAYNLRTGVFVDTAIEKNQTDKDLPEMSFTFEILTIFRKKCCNRRFVMLCKFAKLSSSGALIIV